MCVVVGLTMLGLGDPRAAIGFCFEAHGTPLLGFEQG